MGSSEDLTIIYNTVSMEKCAEKPNAQTKRQTWNINLYRMSTIEG